MLICLIEVNCIEIKIQASNYNQLITQVQHHQYHQILKNKQLQY